MEEVCWVEFLDKLCKEHQVCPYSLLAWDLYVLSEAPAAIWGPWDKLDDRSCILRMVEEKDRRTTGLMMTFQKSVTSCRLINTGLLCSSAQDSCSVMSDSLWPHWPQHARPPCPSPTPGVHPNPCPLSWWCHPIILSSVVPFSSCSQSFPASGSFQMTVYWSFSLFYMRWNLCFD